MGIYIKGRYISDIHTNQRSVKAVYINGRRVWPKTYLIISCFANGYWEDQYPWTDDKSWVD